VAVPAGGAVARDALEAALHAWGQEFESNTLITQARERGPAA
jgi:hypothetical protein